MGSTRKKYPGDYRIYEVTSSRCRSKRGRSQPGVLAAALMRSMLPIDESNPPNGLPPFFHLLLPRLLPILSPSRPACLLHTFILFHCFFCCFHSGIVNWRRHRIFPFSCISPRLTRTSRGFLDVRVADGRPLAPFDYISRSVFVLGETTHSALRCRRFEL